MSRLTKRINGEIYKKGNCESPCSKCDKEFYCDELEDMMNKLADYEDLEEQGRLIEQKHGRWIKDKYSHCYANIYYCSNCFTYERVKTVMGEPAFNYCPNCGAKMEE